MLLGMLFGPAREYYSTVTGAFAGWAQGQVLALWVSSKARTNNCRLPSMRDGLLLGMVAYDFGPLGFPGLGANRPHKHEDLTFWFRGPT